MCGDRSNSSRGEVSEPRVLWASASACTARPDPLPAPARLRAENHETFWRGDPLTYWRALRSFNVRPGMLGRSKKPFYVQATATQAIKCVPNQSPPRQTLPMCQLIDMSTALNIAALSRRGAC